MGNVTRCGLAGRIMPEGFSLTAILPGPLPGPWLDELLKLLHYGFRVDEKYPDRLKVSQATKTMAGGTLHARTGDRLEEAAGGR